MATESQGRATFRASRRPLLSVIVPCYNEEDAFDDLRQALQDLPNHLPSVELEFVLVDDGSRDRTWTMMAQFAAEDQRVRAIRFARNFGHQMAVTCGYDISTGDVAVTLDADLQDPPVVIVEMLEAWQRGADIVFAVRESRQGESAFKLLTARGFYRMLLWMAPEAGPMDAGDFRLMDRAAVLALCSLRERHRYVRGMAGWIGFETQIVTYQRNPRTAGVTKYTLFKMCRLAFDAVFSFSIFPLRLSFVAAAIGTVPLFLYLLYAVYAFYSHNVPLEPGWFSLLGTITIFGVLILLCLGVMGEYVGRIFEQTKNRPLYLIRDRAGVQQPSPTGGGAETS